MFTVPADSKGAILSCIIVLFLVKQIRSVAASALYMRPRSTQELVGKNMTHSPCISSCPSMSRKENLGLIILGGIGILLGFVALLWRLRADGLFSFRRVGKPSPDPLRDQSITKDGTLQRIASIPLDMMK